MANNDTTALRKRQQIAKANRTMFIWVAGVSVVVGIATVVSLFLVQKLFFNERVLSEKQNTVNTLVKDNQTIEELNKNVRVLNTDQSLLDARTDDSSSALEVILDALPSSANSSALGSSLQNKLLPGDNIRIDSLTVNPSGEESSNQVTSEVADTGNSIGFSFTISVPRDNVDSLRELLVRLEKSIRPINVQSINLEIQGDRISAQVTAVSYYEPSKTVQLREKVVKP